MKSTIIYVLTLSGTIMLVGCVAKPQKSADYKPFEKVELDAVLSIVVDLSGSFHDDWQRDGRAHKLFLELVNQFFVDRMGTESKVIIGQISNSETFVLFDGTPEELTKRFRSPQQLNQFLQQNADPKGSKVFRSTTRMFDYLSRLNGVTESTRILTVVLSDMKDSETTPDSRRQAGNDMFNSLKTYSDSGGGVALYFVAEDEISRWRKLFEQAKFRPGSFVIEGQLTETPQLPSFD